MPSGPRKTGLTEAEEVLSGHVGFSVAEWEERVGQDRISRRKKTEEESGRVRRRSQVPQTEREEPQYAEKIDRIIENWGSAAERGMNITVRMERVKPT